MDIKPTSLFLDKFIIHDSCQKENLWIYNYEIAFIKMLGKMKLYPELLSLMYYRKTVKGRWRWLNWAKKEMDLL